MRKPIMAVLLVFSIVLLSSCTGGGDGNGGSSSGSVAGQWVGTAAQEQGGTFTMTLGLAQSGAVVSGSYNIVRPGRTMNGTISGTADAGTINLTFNPHGRGQGAYTGNTITIYWVEDWGGGVIGKSGLITLGKQ